MFWDLTPREIDRVLQARDRAHRREHDEARARNFELAQLIGYAFHEPKKMPKFKPTKTPAQTAATGDAMVRAFLIGLATRGQK